MQPPNRFIARLLVCAVFVTCAWFVFAAPVVAQTTSSDDTASVDEVEPGRSYVQVVAGEEHACGLTDEGEVYCWGSNGNDQLGNQSDVDSPLPVAVNGLDGKAVALAAGGFQTCALMKDGSASCWPINWDVVEPTVLPGLEEDVTALGGGRWHFCAIVDEQLLCWGSNRQLQLGNGAEEDRDEPTPVDGLSGIPVAVAAGRYHTCALLDGGAVQCWGMNQDGQVGDGTKIPRNRPVDVVGLDGPVVGIAAGDDHTCALLESGDVQCWGVNAGIKQSGTQWILELPEPFTISGLGDGITEIAAGGRTTCVNQDGAAVCWSMNNQNSQLGSTNDEWEQGPVTVDGLAAPVTRMDVGSDFVCALLDTGQIQCWGYNQRGQVGAGQATQRDVPLTVRSVISPTTMAIGGWFSQSYTCAVVAGKLRCWGDGSGIVFENDDGDQRGTPVDGPRIASPVKEMTAGPQFACVLQENGAVRCWGTGFNGQLGNGSTDSVMIPTQVVGLAGGVTQVAGGFGHVCALTDGGKVLCWGSNRDGQLGIGEAAEALTPESPVGLEEGVLAIYASDSSTCALLEDGAASCWGTNYSGRLGDGTDEERNEPTPVMVVEGKIVDLAMGSSHTCALLEDGAAQCWGGNWNGQLGDGTVTDALTATVTVQGLPASIVDVAAAGNRTCAILDDGGLWCWGGNVDAELGTGTTAISSTVPAPVLGLGADVAAIYLGPMHSCAVLVDGEVRCWGEDGDGQLGIGTSPNVSKPVTVAETVAPQAGLAAQRAAPGSRIILAGENFPVDMPISVLANGEAISPTLAATGRGALLAWLDAADADPGYYAVTLAVGDAITAADSMSLTMHLLITDTAPLLQPLGGAVPMLTLPAGIARDAADAPAELQQRTYITLKSGVNVRTEPNGDLLATTTAVTDVLYDSGRALDGPVEAVFTDADGAEVILQGVNAAGRVWLPVLWEDEPAWVADVVVSGVVIR